MRFKSNPKFRVMAALLLIAFFFDAQFSFAATLDLSTFLNEVESNNPLIRSYRYRAAAAKDRIRPAGTLDDPFFALGPDQIPFGGGDTEVVRYQLNQTLPFPGKLGAKTKIAAALSEVARSDTDTLIRQTVITATYLFYKSYYLQESLKNYATQIAFVTTIAQSEEGRYKAGESQHHEWLLALAEAGILKTEALQLKREKAILDATLNQYRNRPVDTPIGALTVGFGGRAARNGDENTDKTVTSPEYKAYREQVNAFENGKKLATYSWIPDLMVQGMVMQSKNGMEPSNWGLMVGLNVPLFGYRKQAELVSAAKNDLKSAEAMLAQIETKLKTAETTVRLERDTAQSVVGLYANSVIPQTELAFQSAKSAYETKRLPLSNLLQISRVRQIQRLEYLAARLDAKLAEVKGRELLSEPPFLRMAPSAPTLFAPGGMGESMNGVGTSAIGMGASGMTGPAAKPQKTGSPDGSGMSGGGM